MSTDRILESGFQSELAFDAALLYEEPSFVKEWQIADSITKDHQLVLEVLAHAYYGAAVGVNRSVEHDITHDLPIGASVCILGEDNEKLFIDGRAGDREYGDPKVHAEILVLRHLMYLKRKGAIPVERFKDLTMGVTAECCPGCIHEINAVSDELGIGRVVYGVPRQQ